MYSIRPILKILLLLIPGIGGMLLGYHVLSDHSIALKEGVNKCRKKVPYILAVSLLCGVFCFQYLKSGEPYSGSFKMSYTYPLASKGLAPNNTVLDVSEIFSNEVLEQAIQTGLLADLEPDEIKDTLKINQVKQKGGVSVDNLYVSTEYSISYDASERTLSVDKDLLFKAITEAYYDYFVSKYERKTDVLEKEYDGLFDMDYLDAEIYLQEQIKGIIEYMDMCQSENSTFVSETTKESFSSIKDKARNFQNVSLERYRAYVLKYGISKDKEQYISRLNYENRLENVEYMKNLAGYSVRLAAIDRYEGDITRAVLVPTRDEDGKFYQSRTKIGTDYFASEADEYLKNATGNQLTIETNNYYIESLLSTTESENYRGAADIMIEGLKDEITGIANVALETVKDFDTQTSNGYISFTFQKTDGFMRSCIKKTVVYVIGVCGVWFAVFFTGTDFRSKKKRRFGIV